MFEVQLACVCSNHAWLVGRSLALVSDQSVFPVDPGYNQRLDERARVLLSGQTISGKSQIWQVDF